jgi:glycosyl transferase family 87
MRADARLGRRVIVAVHFALALGFAVSLVRTLLTPEGVVATDFTVFWTGWWLILHGQAHVLYDEAAQRAAQQVLMSGFSFQGGLMAFLNPPHAALAGVPFGWLADHAGERAAFIAWTAISVALLVVLDRRLRETLGVTEGPARWMVTSALFAFYPVFHALNIGQMSLLLAVAALGLHRAADGSRPVAGAAWFLALTIKPQLVPAVFVFLVARRCWRLIAYALGALALAAAITAAVLGPGIWLDYARQVGHLEQFFAQGTVAHMLNLRGSLTRALGASAEPSIDAAAYAIWIVATLLVAVVFASRRIHEAQDTRAAYGLALAVALLSTPHLFVQDAVLWTVPVALYTAALRDSGANWRPFAGFVLSWPILFVVVRLVDLAGGQAPRLRIDPLVVALIVATVVIGRGVVSRTGLHARQRAPLG